MSDTIKIETFYAQVTAEFGRAAQSNGTHDLDYCIAGKHMRFSFAGKALVEPLARAFSHLALSPAHHPYTATAAENGTPTVNIKLWELASTDSVLPPPPWHNVGYTRRGEVPGFSDRRFATTYHPDGRILFLYDALEHTGTVAVFKVADLPVYERAAPLSPILFPALFTHDIQYVHGAAVGLPEGGVLLAGVGGAGKSTTALACLDSALKFAGDDYCAVTIRGEPVVYSLYNSAKGDAETVARLKFLESFVQFWDTEGSGKAIWFLQEHLPHQLIAKFPLRAILIPRVTGEQDTRLARASSHEALVALVPSTIAQLPDAGANVFHGLAALVRNVPAWHLLLGTDMKQIPATILALLNQLGGRGAVA